MSPSDALPTPANQPLPQAGTPNDPTTWNRNGTGILTLCVPEDATVTINGLVTSTQGTVRQYASHGLKPGQAYTYNIQVQLIRNGRLVNELRSVELSSGHTERLVFNDHASDIREIASR